MRHGIKIQKSVRRYGKKSLNIIILVGIAFGVFYFLRWLGLKGLIGIIIGLGFMAYLVLSRNPMLAWAVGKFGADEYIEEMKG